MARQLQPAGRLLLVALASAAVCACEAPGPVPAAGSPTPVGSDVTASAARSNPAASPSSPGPPAVTVATLVGSAPNDSGAGAYRYRVEYPRIQSPDGRAQGIDSVIQGILQRDVDDFVDAARSAPSGPVPSELDCRSRTVRLTARLVVARVDCSQYQAGAAHPSTVVHTFNCDLAGARVLALTVISEAARAQLSRLQAGDAGTLTEGTAPAVANFRDFLLGQDALVVVFARYQVAAGTAGEPEVSVPYEALSRYLAPGITDLVA
jgi:hypothetical protein